MAPVAVGAAVIALVGAVAIDVFEVTYLVDDTFAGRVGALFVGAIAGLGIVLYAIRLDG